MLYLQSLVLSPHQIPPQQISTIMSSRKTGSTSFGNLNTKWSIVQKEANLKSLRVFASTELPSGVPPGRCNIRSDHVCTIVGGNFDRPMPTRLTGSSMKNLVLVLFQGSYCCQPQPSLNQGKLKWEVKL